MWWVSYVMIALPSGQALSVTKTCLVKQGGSSEYFFAVLYFILETLPPKPLTKHYVDILCRHLRKEVSIQHIHSLSKNSLLRNFIFKCCNEVHLRSFVVKSCLDGKKWRARWHLHQSSSIFSSLPCLPALPAWPNTLPG